MPGEQLTAKQRAKALKQKQQAYENQRNRDSQLSLPSQRSMQALEQSNMEAEIVGSKKRANNGLNFQMEQQVITRDMVNPKVQAKIKKVKEESSQDHHLTMQQQKIKQTAENDLAAWRQMTSDPSRQKSDSHERADNAQPKKGTSKNYYSKIHRRKDSEELVNYSKNEAARLELVNGSGVTTFYDGPIINEGVSSPNINIGPKKHEASEYLRSTVFSKMNLSNYKGSQQKNDDYREVFTRMQSSGISREKDKNSRQGENKDLSMISNQRRHSKRRTTQVIFQDEDIAAAPDTFTNSNVTEDRKPRQKSILKPAQPFRNQIREEDQNLEPEEVVQQTAPRPKKHSKRYQEQDLDIFNTIKVNQPRSREQTPPYVDDFDPHPPAKISKRKKQSPPPRPKSAEKVNYHEELEKDLDRKMLSIVHRYTRPGQNASEAGKNGRNSGLGGGIMRTQDAKVNHMRRKLNQSVDLAAIKDRHIQREKIKFENTSIFKEVTDGMTFRSQVFDQNVDKALHPHKSPLVPAAYAREQIEKQRHQKECQDKLNKNPYTTELPQIDGYMKFQTIDAQPQSPRVQLSDIHLSSQLSPTEPSRNMTESKRKGNPGVMSLDNERVIRGKEVSPLGQYDGDSSEEQLFKIDELSQLVDLNNEDYGDDLEHEFQDLIQNKTVENAEDCNIRNRPKREKVNPSALSNSEQQKAEMRQAEKVFNIIHNYCKDSVEVGYNLLDKHFEDLLDPTINVSPLLKYFNLFAKHTNFRLPSRSVLEFDQKFFKQQIEKLRGAQKVEVKWVRKSVVEEARKTLYTAFEQSKIVMQDEIKHVLYKYEEKENQLKKQELENKKLQSKIFSLESIINGQKQYINSVQSKLFEDDKNLFISNGGPGGAYDQFIIGDVIQTTNQYHALLKENVKQVTEEIKLNMTEDYVKAAYSKIVNEQHVSIISKEQTIKEQSIDPHASIYSSVTSIADNRSQSNQVLHTAQTPVSKNLVLSRIEDVSETRSKPPALKGSQMSLINTQQSNSTYKSRMGEIPWVNYEKYVPKLEECSQKLEPLLKSPLDLFGGHINLSMKDVQQVMAEETYKCQKIEIKKMMEMNEGLRAENFASAVLMHELNITNDRLQEGYDRMVFELKDLRSKFKAELKIIKREAKDSIRKVRDECREVMGRMHGIYTLELGVAEAIIEKVRNDNAWQAERLRKFATMLRIPRLHNEYIEKHGVNEFVDYCEDVVKRERAIEDVKEARKQQAEARTKYSVLEFKKRRQDLNRSLDIHKRAPFMTQIPTQGIRRQDHQSHKKPKLSKAEIEDQEILDKLAQCEILRNKSALDLSELIRKHWDRQPQLLALIQPDFKRQLLNDPVLMKSLEKIKKQDPINQRVKEIQDFIRYLKAETYEKKFFFNTIDEEILFDRRQNHVNKSQIVSKEFLGGVTPPKKFRNSLVQTIERPLASPGASSRFEQFSPLQSVTPSEEETVIIQVNTAGTNFDYGRSPHRRHFKNESTLQAQQRLIRKEELRQAFIARSMILRNKFTSVQNMLPETQNLVDQSVFDTGTQDSYESKKRVLREYRLHRENENRPTNPVTVASEMGLQSALQNYHTPPGAQAHFNMSVRDVEGVKMQNYAPRELANDQSAQSILSSIQQEPNSSLIIAETPSITPKNVGQQSYQYLQKLTEHSGSGNLITKPDAHDNNSNTNVTAVTNNNLNNAASGNIGFSIGPNNNVQSTAQFRPPSMSPKGGMFSSQTAAQLSVAQPKRQILSKNPSSSPFKSVEILED